MMKAELIQPAWENRLFGKG